MVALMVLVAVAITTTESLATLATNSFVPSPVTAMPSGPLLTGSIIVDPTVLVAVATTEMVLSAALAT